MSYVTTVPVREFLDINGTTYFIWSVTVFPNGKAKYKGEDKNGNSIGLPVLDTDTVVKKSNF